MRTNKGKAFLASFIGLLVMVLAACGSTSTTTGNSGGYSFTYNPTTPSSKGGTVVFGDWQAPDNLNPFLTTSVVSVEVYNALWDSCLVQLPDLSLGLNGYKPDQCSEIPTVANGDVSTDGTTTLLKVDPNAKWSDGQPITASDFKFTIDVGSDPNVYGAPPYTNILKTQVVDTHTLKITWTNDSTTPGAFAPYLNVVAGLFPLPVHSYPGVYDASGAYSTTAVQALTNQESFLTKFPTDNGAYTVQSFASDSIVLIPNPNFHSNFYKGPYLDKLIFKSTGDKDVMIQSFKTGTYDKVENLTVADLPKLADLPAGQVTSAPQIAMEHFEFNIRPDAANSKANGGTSIFSDANVRKAFVEGFDRCTALSAIIGQGCSTPNLITNELTAPPAFDYTANTAWPAYNPTDAAKLMDAAGYKLVSGHRTYKDGSTKIAITLVTTSGNPVRATFLAFAAQQWGANLGITVNVQTYKASQLFGVFNKGGILATSQYDISLFAYTFGPDPGLNFDNLVGPNTIPSVTNAGGGNYSGVVDTTVNTALANGDKELDFAKRAQIYKDMQTYISSQYYFYPLYVRPNITLVKPTLGNYKQDPTSVGDDWNMNDWFTTAKASS